MKTLSSLQLSQILNSQYLSYLLYDRFIVNVFLLHLSMYEATYNFNYIFNPGAWDCCD